MSDPRSTPATGTPETGLDAPRGVETATLGGGCFWCLEAVFQDLEGVLEVTSGYAGGEVADPTYRQVCAGDTGHAEVVQVRFDPERLDFRDLLRVFFTVHDPTTLNRQGADVGPQYRSIVLYHDERQQRVAREVIEEIAREALYDGTVVTEVVPLNRFYRAEDYHQNYFRNNPTQGYCQAVIAPKVAKFRRRFSDRLRQSA